MMSDKRQANLFFHSTTNSMPFDGWVLCGFMFLLLLNSSDGCLRRSSPSNDQDSQHNHSPSTMVDRTTPAAPQRWPCHPEELRRAACLNGGQCFAYPGYNHNRHIACKCQPEFTGERCQEFYIDPEILRIQDQNIRTAHVTAAVSVCVLFAFVALLIVYVYIKFRRKATLPPEAQRGPRLEMGKSYNQSSIRSTSAGYTKISPNCTNDMQCVAQAALLTKTPLLNGKDDQVNNTVLDNQPLLNGKDDQVNNTVLDNQSIKRNGDLPSRQNSSAPLRTSSVSQDGGAYCPSLDDIRYIDDTTLPRKPKHNNNNSEDHADAHS